MKKSEVGSRKSEVGSPKSEVRKKSEVGSKKSEEENNSAPDSYRDEYPTSETKKELPTANSKLPTETMEVHHHPEVEKKGFKQYFLEFLMIFLAVTMGFFAESIREHVSDREKEKDFMRSMVQDLQADTAALHAGIKDFKGVFSAADTLLTCLKSDKPDGDIINRVVSHRFWIYTGYSYNNRTIQQLKNSGNFRLIQNSRVTDSIVIYDNYQNGIMLTQYNDLKNTMYAYKDIEARAIHYKELQPSKFLKGAAFSLTDFAPTKKPAFITADKELISLYYNRVYIHEQLGRLFIINMKRAADWATRLIAFIKKEYHLQDE